MTEFASVKYRITFVVLFHPNAKVNYCDLNAAKCTEQGAA